MAKQRLAAALVLLSVMLITPITPRPSAAAGPYCGCGKTGTYVDPQTKDPSSVSTKGAAKSPKGTYTISATPGNPTTITVTDTSKSPNKTVFSEQISGDVYWYFSPDDTHLVLDVLSQQQEDVLLYDLTAPQPANAIWNSSSSAVSSSNIAFSSRGKYLLYGALTDSLLSLRIVDTTKGHLALNESSLPAMTGGWGFSPDEDRFLYVSSGATILYDLTKGGPAQTVWTDSSAAPSSGYAFSPKGGYLLAAGLTNGNHVSIDLIDTGAKHASAIYSDQFDFSSVPGVEKNKFGSVGWGFSPDDSTFVYGAVTDQTPSLTVVSLSKTSATSGTIALQKFNGAWWSFSPCGDILAVVDQTSGTYAQVSLYQNGDTTTAAKSETFNVASLDKKSIKTTDAGQVVHAAGQDIVLLPFDPTCPSAGGGNAGGGGAGNGGGNGGGGGGGVPKPPLQLLTVVSGSAVPPLVVGGDSGTIQVSTKGVGTLQLSSDNKTVADVIHAVNVTGSGQPQVVDVPITTTPVTSDTLVTITANGRSGAIHTSASITLLVIPPCDTSTPAPALAEPLTLIMAPIQGPPGPGNGGPPGAPINVTVSIDPMYVSGGGQVNGTVTVIGPHLPKVDFTVSLSSSDTNVATVPDTITIPAGQRSATFVVQSSTVTSDSWVSISATLGQAKGSGTPAQLLVLTPSVPESVTFDPASVDGGNPATGTLTLTAPPIVCSGGTVDLSSNNPDVAGVPASVTIPSGTTSVTFPVTTTAVDSDTDVKITASNDNGSASGTLTVTASVTNHRRQPAAICSPGAATTRGSWGTRPTPTATSRSR